MTTVVPLHDELQRQSRPPLWPIVTIAVLLALPKITLVNALGSAIRVDDPILAIAGVLALSRASARRFTRVDLFFFAWIASMILSSVVAIFYTDRTILSGLVFAIRPAEYWLISRVAIVGRVTLDRVAKVIGAVIAVNSIVAILQFMGALGSFSRFSSERGSAFFNGPYELAAVAVGSLALNLGTRRRVQTGLAAVALVVSAARITIVGAFVVAVARYVRTTAARRARATLVSLGALGLLVAATFAQIPNPLSAVSDRFDTSAGDSIRHGLKVSRFYPVHGSSRDYQRVAVEKTDRFLANIPPDLDASTVIRFGRWSILFRTVTSAQFTTLLGLGPGWAGVAVDGMFMRVFVEGGLVGIVAFGLFLATMLRHYTGPLRQYLIALMITGLFIDIFVSLKPMLLLWVAVGAIERERVQRLNAADSS